MKVFANPLKLFKRTPFLWGVRSWFKYTFNKDHLAVMKEAYKGRPYDYGFLYQLEKTKIKEMSDYLEKADRFVGVEFVVRDMRICLSLLEIMLGERSTFHYTGDLVFKEIPEEEKKEGEFLEGDKMLVPTPGFKYYCDVHVNLKNMKRFVSSEKLCDFYTIHPHEFYELKARALYHKIRFDHEEEWWD